MDLAGFARKRLDTRFVGGGAKMQFISTVSHKKTHQNCFGNIFYET